jgi:hypothetical protein
MIDDTGKAPLCRRVRSILPAAVNRYCPPAAFGAGRQAGRAGAAAR